MKQYIAIEGGEYVGKSSLINELEKYLPNVFFVREPGGTPVGEKLRTLLREEVHCPVASMLGFAMQRALISHELLEKVDDKTTVISDRCYITSVIYQSLMGGIDKDKIIALHETFIKYLPKKVIYLTASPEAINQRKEERGAETDILGSFADKERELVNSEYILTLHQIRNNNDDFEFVVIDTSNLTKEEVVKEALLFINK